ncbi:Transmembrane protein 14A [Coelomomyces lativittatus]|nr:Transmembrane protein 14A [Coelomomyces lativittatus]KAJ1501633.1 Transmembrane protein 14A [Coelomomyces lativittatus]KAJ1501848.1 Transmembrane protein 14A [Coelomomyces lativittatus]
MPSHFLTRSLEPHTDFIALMYSLLLGMGGIYAYLKVGSLPSLLMGLFSSSLGLFATLCVSRNPMQVGPMISVSLLLSLIMALRFYKSQKWMPAGVLSILSLLIVLRYSERYIKAFLNQYTKKKRF